MEWQLEEPRLVQLRDELQRAFPSTMQGNGPPTKMRSAVALAAPVRPLSLGKASRRWTAARARGCQARPLVPASRRGGASLRAMHSMVGHDALLRPETAVSSPIPAASSRQQPERRGGAPGTPHPGRFVPESLMLGSVRGTLGCWLCLLRGLITPGRW